MGRGRNEKGMLWEGDAMGRGRNGKGTQWEGDAIGKGTQWEENVMGNLYRGRNGNSSYNWAI